MSNFKYSRPNGIKNGLKIKGSNDEVKIARKFSKFFHLTFSKQGIFKTTDYTINFLQPDDKLRESFNLFNEVLLLFSPYTVFERRTLDFIDKTLSQYENRLDKVCIFIVSKDENISNIIKQINKDNKDSKILIPFTYNELLQNDFDASALHKKLRVYFYNRDLFALESPLKTDAYFFGRNNTVQAFYDKYSLGEQSGLFGLRKIGKTSVLYALERLITLRKGNCIYIDCQNPSVHKCRWNELLHYIIQEIIQKYELDYKLFNSEEKYIERLASKSFEQDIKNVFNNLNNLRILLIFDEIEHITFKTSTSLHWTENTDFIYFWQTLRSIFQKDNKLFSFIITGVNPLSIETPSINGYDNPIFGMINPIYLDLFKIIDVKNMISNIGKYMGLNFDEEIFTLLTEDYGGHPFLIRHICSLINSEVTVDRPHLVSKYDYKMNKSNYDKSISSNVKQILETLERCYPKEYSLLEILAVKGNDEFKKNILNSDNSIIHLEGYGILKESSGNYFITINAITQYIKQSYNDKQKPDSEKETWKVVCSKRNVIESKLKCLIINSLNLNFGPKNLKNKILEIIDQKRKEELNSIEIKNLVSDKLYLLDLKKIIIKNWSVFEKIFNDKFKFESFLELINKFRVDAHAKSISDDDFGILMIAFNWFEEKLENVVLM